MILSLEGEAGYRDNPEKHMGEFHAAYDGPVPVWPRVSATFNVAGPERLVNRSVRQAQRWGLVPDSVEPQRIDNPEQAWHLMPVQRARIAARGEDLDELQYALYESVPPDAQIVDGHAELWREERWRGRGGLLVHVAGELDAMYDFDPASGEWMANDVQPGTSIRTAVGLFIPRLNLVEGKFESGS